MPRPYYDLTIHLRRAEAEELHALAKRAGVSVTDAVRFGARMWLEARLQEPTPRGRPRKDGSRIRQSEEGK